MSSLETPVQPIFSPVLGLERIHILDILRGFAVFGILAVNIAGFSSPVFYPGFVSPEQLPWYDELAEKLLLFFAEGKFYTIFSFLFGLGFSVQMVRAEAKGRDVRTFYPRRLWLLFGLGLLHTLFFWVGDILRHYALLGFALLGFRKRSSRTLSIWAGVFFALGFLLLGLFGGPHGSVDQEAMPMDVIGIARETYNNGSFLDVVFFQFFSGFISFIMIGMTQAASVMALFLLGLLVGRIRFFENLPENRATLKKVVLWGLLVGLVFNAFFVFSENAWLASLGFIVGAPALAAVYVSGLSLLSLKESGAKLLAPLASVGRMALTNYILQSVVCSLIFNGYGLGLYDNIGAAGLWGITIVIYLVQIPLSVWWLSRFRFGPLEWLWRSLTYGKRQQMRN
jgi:uncharacterized protein